MVTYKVRIYCEDCKDYKYTLQEEIDEDWYPVECAGHRARDFVIVEEVGGE